jgi:hypothetical protein
MSARILTEVLEPRQMLSATTPVKPGPVVADAAVAFTATLDRLPKLHVKRLSQLAGSIDWGDGTTGSATFARDPRGGIDVIGTHTFATAGTYDVSIGLTEATTKPAPLTVIELGTATTTVTVTSTVTGTTLTETAGKKFTANLGTFTRFTVDQFFTGVINWGDGHTSKAALIGGDLAQGVYQVTGKHAYHRTGTYTVRTTIYEQIAGSKLTPSVVFDIISTITVMGRA